MRNTIFQTPFFNENSLYRVIEPDNVDLEFPRKGINDKELNTSSDYDIIPESEVSDRKIDLYFKFMKTISKTDLKLTQEQESACMGTIKQIVEFLPKFNSIFIKKTSDDEIQLIRNIERGYTSLIIDEYGGATFIIMREKGFGYACNYFKHEELDKKTLYNLSKNFLAV